MSPSWDAHITKEFSHDTACMRTGTFSLFRVHLPCGTVISSQRNLNPVCQSHNINRINTADYVKKGRLFLLVKKFYGILLLTNHAVPLSEILFLRTEIRKKQKRVTYFLFHSLWAKPNQSGRLKNQCFSSKTEIYDIMSPLTIGITSGQKQNGMITLLYHLLRWYILIKTMFTYRHSCLFFCFFLNIYHFFFKFSVFYYYFYEQII